MNPATRQLAADVMTNPEIRDFELQLEETIAAVIKQAIGAKGGPSDVLNLAVGRVCVYVLAGWIYAGIPVEQHSKLLNNLGSIVGASINEIETAARKH